MMLNDMTWIRRQLVWCYFQVALRHSIEKDKPNWVAGYLAMALIVFGLGFVGVSFLIDKLLTDGQINDYLSNVKIFHYRGDVTGVTVLLGFLPALIAAYCVCVYGIDRQRLSKDVRPISGKNEWVRFFLILMSGFIIYIFSSTAGLILFS